MPLDDLILSRYQKLSFYHLPKRQRGLLYTEVTSANRDTSYPLAPDFTFHLEYNDDHVVLYSDYGPGCVHRIYLFPSLPTHTDKLYQMTARDLRDSFISLEVDRTTLRYSLEHFMSGKEWPFLSPFNTQHRYLASGMGSYTPICYQRSLKISYIPSEPLPANLFETTVNCSKHDLHCPVHIYSSVSRVKFPTDAHVEPFIDSDVTDVPQPYKRRVEKIGSILQEPENHVPGLSSDCKLECIEVCKGCKRVILNYHGPGVLSSILMRVFETSNHKLRQDWTDIRITANFDGRSPSIDKVPLGSLFGVTASLNQFRAAALGKTKRSCSYDDALLSLPSDEITGYFYYPMPFWKSAKITIDGSDFIDAPLLACFQINVVENYYDSSETGYFHAVKTYYDDDASGYRKVLSLGGSWGHIVGVMMEVENLRVVRDVPVNERWPALQADAVIYIDGAKAASVLGTGLEDYFSYAHGFNMAENTTYAFVGNYHASPRRKEPLTWHCYRLHVLDPIYFSSSIQFIMEGTSRLRFQSRHSSITYDEYMQKRADSGGCISHLVYFYMGTSSGTTATDSFHMSNDISEAEHQFEIATSSSSISGGPFTLSNKRYLGASNKNETFDFSGRAFYPGDRITFSMMCLPHNRGIILRREFHSIPKVSWNELAKLWIDDVYIGMWAIPMGALSDEYSIRQEDFTIGELHTKDKNAVVLNIEMLTEWRDISYRVFSIS